MACLIVRQPGLLTTVQDLGRPGLGKFGVSPSGAMDPFALRVANRLVGNADSAAALEVTAEGPEIEFVDAVTFAIGGGNLRASLDDVPVEPWTSATADSGARLRFGRRLQGARCYVAFAGGLRVGQVLGSAATDLEAGIGGFEGRPLREGDRLEVGRTVRGSLRAVHLAVHRPYADPFIVRFVPAHDGDLPPGVVHRFGETAYRVSRHSNRMGYRLEGPCLEHDRRGDALSEPVPPGAIQLPPDGQPIVLMADRPTVGGYPRLGCVIVADMPKAAQLWPGHTVRFRQTSMAEAMAVLEEQRSVLAGVVTP